MHMLAVVGLRVRPAILEADDMLYVKHSSVISLVLSEVMVMGIHWTVEESVMSKFPFAEV